MKVTIIIVVSKLSFLYISPFITQANETGGSQQTELEGAKRCFSYLQRLGLTIAIFVSDWHRGIAKWIRENCVNTRHYYDIWHVARSLAKKLLSLSKEKGCEIIKHWMKGIRRHIYWCATSTKAGFESLIIAKWNSFMRHVSNKHDNHPDSLYQQCHHGELEPRKWIRVGEEFLLLLLIIYCIDTMGTLLFTWHVLKPGTPEQPGTPKLRYTPEHWSTTEQPVNHPNQPMKANRKETGVELTASKPVFRCSELFRCSWF